MNARGPSFSVNCNFFVIFVDLINHLESCDRFEATNLKLKKFTSWCYRQPVSLGQGSQRLATRWWYGARVSRWTSRWSSSFSIPPSRSACKNWGLEWCDKSYELLSQWRTTARMKIASITCFAVHFPTRSSPFAVSIVQAIFRSQLTLNWSSTVWTERSLNRRHSMCKFSSALGVSWSLCGRKSGLASP